MATLADQMSQRRIRMFGSGAAPGSGTNPTVNQVAPTPAQWNSMTTAQQESAPSMPASVRNGGLLRMTAAPAVAPVAPTAPSYDDSTASNVNKVIANNSPLMQQAAATGMATANRRGLLNSSMAAGAAQGEVLKAATAIGGADAQINAQKNIQNTDIAAQMQRLQVSNDAEMTRLEAQLANANEQQRIDIQAQMERLNTTNAAEMARLQEQGRIQGGLQGQAATAEMERLRTQLASTEGQQRAGIAAEMERLQAQINAQTAMSAQEFQQQGMLNEQQAAAEMARLQTQLAGASAQQRADLTAQMDRLVYGTNADAVRQQREQENQRLMQSASFANETAQKKTELAARMAELTTQLTAQQAMQTQNLTSEEKRQALQLNVQQAMQQAEFANLNAQQKAEIGAQMERLVVSGNQELQRLGAAAGYDQQRIRLQGDIDKALQASGGEQQRQLAQLQGQIQSTLQAQTDGAAMQRLGLQLTQEMQMQDKTIQADLAKIAAAGDQDVRRELVAADAARQNLAMQLAAGDREKVAQTAVQLFQAEAAIRQGLLANTSMPAAERAAYEQAISRLGDPARAFINQLYGGTGAQQTTGGTSAMVAPPPVTNTGTNNPAGPIMTTPTPAPSGGGLLNQGAAPINVPSYTPGSLTALERRRLALGIDTEDLR